MRVTAAIFDPAVLFATRFSLKSPPEERFVAEFTAYFDESGTHEGSEAVAVAGYLSTPELWEKFEVEWREALGDFGIEFFHMTDFAARRQQFAGWPEEKRRACLSRLVDITNRHVIASAGTVIPVSDYQAVFSKKADHFVGGPYGVAAMVCFSEMAKMFKLIGVHGQVAYVFESGAQGSGQVQKAFTWLEQDPGSKAQYRLLSLSFQNKRQFCPLQAADILAYELYLYFPKALKKSERAVRYGVKALAEAPRDWGRLDMGTLEEWARIVEIRADMDESELERAALPVPTGRPAFLLSIDELKARWRWWKVFNGQDGAATVQRG